MDTKPRAQMCTQMYQVLLPREIAEAAVNIAASVWQGGEAGVFHLVGVEK